MTTFNQPHCPGQEETVLAYLDAALTSAEQATFEQHLSGCPVCQTLLADWQQVFVEMDGLELVAPPPTIVPQVMAHLPPPHRASAGLTVWGWVGVALQILVGLWFMIQAWPGLLSLVQPYQSFWRPELLLTLPLVSLFSWLREIGQTLLTFDPTTWLATSNYLGWNLSFSLTLGLVLALAFAWLISTGLLLRQRPSTFRNGGTPL